MADYHIWVKSVHTSLSPGNDTPEMSCHITSLTLKLFVFKKEDIDGLKGQK